MLAPGLNRGVEIRLAAGEPHVQNLGEFLAAGGVDIQGLGTPLLKVAGRNLPLGKIDQAVIPDELEISAFAVLAAVTRSQLELWPVNPIRMGASRSADGNIAPLSDISVVTADGSRRRSNGVNYNFLDAVLLQLEKMNVNFEPGDEVLKIMPPVSPYRSHRIQSGLYPKLVSDHLPPFAVLATQAEGTSLVHDWLYEARQSYLRELAKMGANVAILDPHRAIIAGPTPLYGKEVSSYDIRSGMTMVVAALSARGRTVISGVEHIDRGYEDLEGRLKAIGADITRVND